MLFTFLNSNKYIQVAMEQKLNETDYLLYRLVMLFIKFL